MNLMDFDPQGMDCDPKEQPNLYYQNNGLRPVRHPVRVDPRDAIYGSPELLLSAREWLTIPEVSYILRLGDTKLREMRDSKELPAEKFGRSVRYHVAVIRAYRVRTN